MELSIDILHLFATCRWKFPATFFLIFLKIPMIFAFAFKTSVKLFIDSLSLFAKCRWKFLSTSFYLLRKSMIFCFRLEKRRWKISSILCRSISKMSMEMRISKSESNLQGFSQICRVLNKFTENEQFLIKRFTSGKNIVF